MNGLDSSASLGMTFRGSGMTGVWSGCGEFGWGRRGLCMNGLDSSASLGMTFRGTE